MDHVIKNQLMFTPYNAELKVLVTTSYILQHLILILINFVNFYPCDIEINCLFLFTVGILCYFIVDIWTTLPSSWLTESGVGVGGVSK